MQIFRKYTDLDKLTESGQWQLSQLLCDNQRLSVDPGNDRVFTEGKPTLPSSVMDTEPYRKEATAPSWSFKDKEGVEVGLDDFAGKKLLLHIGWADNLDIAMTDMQSFQEAQDQLPEIVHLLAASSKDQFNKHIAGKKGLFIFVPPEEMEVLKESYFIANRSNHYFLIGEDGKILANHYDLGTASKLRGTWEKMAKLPPTTAWTPEQRLQFWQSLGIGALIMLMISGAVLWQRRIITRRDQRRRQLLGGRIARYPIPNEPALLIQCDELYSEPDPQEGTGKSGSVPGAVCGPDAENPSQHRRRIYPFNGRNRDLSAIL